MLLLENFNSEEPHRQGDKVVVRTERGLEGATVVCEVPQEDEHAPPKGTVVRATDEHDHERLRHIEEDLSPDEMRRAKELVKKHGLPMKLVYIEHILGGENIVFYFRADGRVDFRQLVRDMAREFNTRIELKQIGARDEAKLLANFDHCGRELCCRAFLRQMKPVSMKMAKNQKATLDPAKISGRCGRLMCCLRYEDAMYEEMKRSLPRKGYRIETTRGEAEVVELDILGQKALVQFEGGSFESIGPEEIVRELGRARRGSRRGPSKGGEGRGASKGESRETSKSAPDKGAGQPAGHSCPTCPHKGSPGDNGGASQGESTGPEAQKGPQNEPEQTASEDESAANRSAQPATPQPDDAKPGPEQTDQPPVTPPPDRSGKDGKSDRGGQGNRRQDDKGGGKPHHKGKRTPKRRGGKRRSGKSRGGK
jgi:cell fate regulator YaaT (PSP1 superfamily)